MKKIITLCSSVSFYPRMFDIEKVLKSYGFKVIIPTTAKHIRKNKENFDADKHKSWMTDRNDYHIKTRFMKDHFKKVLLSDAILVVNYRKSKYEGYIGGNVLMEMVLAFHYKKRIFILNQIDEELPIKEEVYGMNPIFVRQDLSILAKKLL